MRGRPPVGKVWDHGTAQYIELPWDGSHHPVMMPANVPNPKPADQPAHGHPVHHSSPQPAADVWSSAPVGEDIATPQAQHLRHINMQLHSHQHQPPAHQHVMQEHHHHHQHQHPGNHQQLLPQQQQLPRKKLAKPQGTPKPRGRPPKHHYWDGHLGKYVPEVQSPAALPVHPPFAAASPVKRRDDEGIILGSEDKRRRVSLGRPRGRPPKDCRWDNDQGRYVQMAEAQPLPTAVHVEATIQHAIQPLQPTPVLAQLPTQAVTQAMNPPPAV